MPVSEHYRPDPLHQRLPRLSDEVAPARFPRHILRHRDQAAAAEVGLDTLTDGEWEAAFARFEPLPGNLPRPLALRYHGHQFLTYNPSLGDGRGFLYAQLRDRRGRLMDLGTKGSGRTMYARGGDGKLTLKGGFREILAAALLDALGVPTSRALSLYETGESLIRGDEPSPTRSGVLVRLSWGHVRIGTFQRLEFEDDAQSMRALLEHCVAVYYPHLLDRPDLPAALLAEVAEALARTTGAWMAAGFVHGVLNSDNLNITGESFDYGPWRFLPWFDPSFVAAYFDHSGLYSFGRQPVAVHHALSSLAEALELVGERASLQAPLRSFAERVGHHFRLAFLRRLGCRASHPDAAALISAWIPWAEQREQSFARFFFDWYAGPLGAPRALTGPSAAVYLRPAFAPVRAALGALEPTHPERLAHPYLDRPEPFDLRIEELEALWEPVSSRDDWAPMRGALDAIASLRDLSDDGPA